MRKQTENMRKTNRESGQMTQNYVNRKNKPRMRANYVYIGKTNREYAETNREYAENKPRKRANDSELCI